MTRFSTMKAVTSLWRSHSFGQGCSKDISLMLCSSYSRAGSDIFSYRCTLPFNGASTCNGYWEGTGLGQVRWQEGKEEKSPVLFLGPKDLGPQDSFPVPGCPFCLF